MCSYRRRDATRQWSRVGVGGVHWAIFDYSKKISDYQSINKFIFNSGSVAYKTKRECEKQTRLEKNIEYARSENAYIR